MSEPVKVKVENVEVDFFAATVTVSVSLPDGKTAVTGIDTATGKVVASGVNEKTTAN